MSKKQKLNIIASNKKSRHEYSLESFYVAGLVLQGWELKSIRQGRIQLKESYIILKHGEAWLIGAHISPLITASTHINADPTRTRKLLLHKKELEKLIGAVARQGYTVVPVDMHWKDSLVKLNIALGKGKKLYDKRASAKERDWKLSKTRLLKSQR